MTSDAYAIETRELTKRFDQRVAVNELTLSVKRGEIFGFLGPNGAGKTTAVKMLLGLVRPTSGDAAILGKPLQSLAARRATGYLPELFRYQEWLTAREVCEWHAAVLRVSRHKRRGHIDDTLHRVGLGERADDRVGTYSKGMQQRLGIGVALLGDPKLIVLDEPTSALDPVGRADVRALLPELQANGATIFLNSHLLAEVEAVCDRVAVIDRGNLIATGSLDELLGHFGLRITFAEIGEPLAQQLSARGALLDGQATATFDRIDEDTVPSLIADLVRNGAAIKAVQPIRRTLEERFLELLNEES
ncbi:MAG: ABC transporter ATP-binding protein [Candidatus Eremiobacteraeota bacterium]|nr:ABC transporter ATP-binding protein [Candidatus Eremiobacteraeota bacterium]